MPSANLVVSIRKYLNLQYIFVDETWLIECVEHFLTSLRESDINIIQSNVREQFYLNDLRDICKGCLPEHLELRKEITLPNKYVLQINSIIDIGRPAYQQFMEVQNLEYIEKDEEKISPYRMLKLNMTDGVQDVVGIEYRTVNCLDANIPPGFKILIKGPVTCRNGMLLLEEKNCELLDGEVNELMETNSQSAILERQLQLFDSDNTTRITMALVSSKNAQESMPSTFENQQNSSDPLKTASHDFNEQSTFELETDSPRPGPSGMASGRPEIIVNDMDMEVDIQDLNKLEAQYSGDLNRVDYEGVRTISPSLISSRSLSLFDRNDKPSGDDDDVIILSSIEENSSNEDENTISNFGKAVCITASNFNEQLTFGLPSHSYRPVPSGMFSGRSEILVKDVDIKVEPQVDKIQAQYSADPQDYKGGRTISPPPISSRILSFFDRNDKPSDDDDVIILSSNEEHPEVLVKDIDIKVEPQELGDVEAEYSGDPKEYNGVRTISPPPIFSRRLSLSNRNDNDDDVVIIISSNEEYSCVDRNHKLSDNEVVAELSVNEEPSNYIDESCSSDSDKTICIAPVTIQPTCSEMISVTSKVAQECMPSTSGIQQNLLDAYKSASCNFNEESIFESDSSRPGPSGMFSGRPMEDRNASEGEMDMHVNTHEAQLFGELNISGDIVPHEKKMKLSTYDDLSNEKEADEVILNIKHVKRIKNKSTKTYIVNAKVEHFLTKLSVTKECWHVSCNISDGTGNIDVSFSNEILQHLTGYTPKQMYKLKKKIEKGQEVKEKGNLIIREGKEKIKKLNRIMKLKFESDSRIPTVIELTNS